MGQETYDSFEFLYVHQRAVKRFGADQFDLAVLADTDAGLRTIEPAAANALPRPDQLNHCGHTASRR